MFLKLPVLAGAPGESSRAECDRLVTAVLAVAVAASVDWQLCRGVFSPTELALFVMVGVVFVAAGLVAKSHRPQDNLGCCWLPPGCCGW